MNVNWPFMTTAWGIEKFSTFFFSLDYYSCKYVSVCLNMMSDLGKPGWVRRGRQGNEEEPEGRGKGQRDWPSRNLREGRLQNIVLLNTGHLVPDPHSHFLAGRLKANRQLIRKTTKELNIMEEAGSRTQTDEHG